MKIILMMLLGLLFIAQGIKAQGEENQPEKKGLQKENLFLGGSLSAAFASNVFAIGGSPEFGYSFGRWVDVGVVGNYNYTSYRQYRGGDKLRQTIFGAGLFTRIFPVNFLFAQAQFEHNWITLKQLYGIGGSDKNNVSANSLLVGAGYTSGRDPLGKSAYGYLAVLVDVLNEENSPYVSYEFNPVTQTNRPRQVPVFRAGFIFPLFQGGSR